MKPGFSIRPYADSDEDELVELWFRSTTTGQNFLPVSFWEELKPKIREVFIPLSETWIVENEGKMLGFIALLGDLIGALFIDPDQQGQGLGSALIDHATRMRKNPLSVEVFEKNVKARRFYEKQGFGPGERRFHEESGEWVLILKRNTAISHVDDFRGDVLGFRN